MLHSYCLELDTVITHTQTIHRSGSYYSSSPLYLGLRHRCLDLFLFLRHDEFCVAALHRQDAVRMLSVLLLDPTVQRRVAHA
jgi:hypothetical protein